LYSRSFTFTQISIVPSSFLVDEFAVEGDADRGQEETGVLVCRGGGVDDDVATGDHFRWVPGGLSAYRDYLTRSQNDLHVIVDLDLGERCNLFGGETKGDVARVVTRASLDTSPLLHLGHDNIDTLAQEVVHVLALQIASDGHVLAGADAETGDGLFGGVGCRAHVCDGLHSHAGNVEVGGVGDGALDHGVYCYPLDLGHVAECDFVPQQAEHITTSGSAQRTVLEVWRFTLP
jgi:hypothetical protein